jgi:transposase
MTYTTKYRNEVLTFIDRGNSVTKAFEIFGISRSTINDWKKLRAETGSAAAPEKPPRSTPVYPGEKLRTFIENNPLALGKEIAAHFGGSTNGAYEALKREGITLKR